MSLVLPINHLTEEYDFQVVSSYITMQNPIFSFISVYLYEELNYSLKFKRYFSVAFFQELSRVFFAQF